MDEQYEGIEIPDELDTKPGGKWPSWRDIMLVALLVVTLVLAIGVTRLDNHIGLRITDSQRRVLSELSEVEGTVTAMSVNVSEVVDGLTHRLFVLEKSLIVLDQRITQFDASLRTVERAVDPETWQLILDEVQTIREMVSINATADAGSL